MAQLPLPTGWLPAHKLTRPTIDTGCDGPTTFHDPPGGMRAIAGTPGRRGRRDEPAGSSRTCVGRATVSHIKGSWTAAGHDNRLHRHDFPRKSTLPWGRSGTRRAGRHEVPRGARGVPGPEAQARKSPDHGEGTGVGGEASDEPRGCPEIIMPSAWPVAMGRQKSRRDRLVSR
jgi:hypothetical protein